MSLKRERWIEKAAVEAVRDPLGIVNLGQLGRALDAIEQHYEAHLAKQPSMDPLMKAARDLDEAYTRWVDADGYDNPELDELREAVGRLRTAVSQVGVPPQPSSSENKAPG